MSRRATRNAQNPGQLMTVGEVLDHENQLAASPVRPFAGAPSSLPSEQPDEETGLTDSEAEELSAIENVRIQLGSIAREGATVYVYRIPADRKSRDIYLFNAPAAEFDIDSLLYNYGGGSYRIRGFVPQDDASNPKKLKLFANSIVDLEESVAAKLAREKRAAEPPASANPNTEMLAVLQAMQASTQRSLEAIGAAIAASAKPNESREVFLRELVQMRQIFAPERAPEPAQNSNPLDMVEKLLSITHRIREDAEPKERGDALSTALEIIGKPLATALMAQQANKMTAPIAPMQLPAQLPTPNPLPAPVQSLSPQQTSESNMPPQEPINNHDEAKAAVEFIMNAARTNQDVEPIGNMILDHMGDEIGAQISRDDKQWSELLSQFPETASYANWFNELRQCIIELTESEEPDKSDEPSTVTGLHAVPGAPRAT